MSSRKMKLGDFLIRSKIPVDIEDNKQYKRVTIRTKHQGVSVRDFEIGSKIGTKKQFILKAGQFVLSKIDAMYGAFGIAPDEVDGAIITGNFWAYDYDKNIVSIEWLNHFTNSPDFYDLCRRASTGITHRKYLDEDFFLSYEVNLPDIDKQNNLVVSIDNIRDKIGSLENELNYQLTQLENLNQAILQEAVQGKLVAQDPKDEPASELLKRIKAEKAKSGKKEKPLPPIKPEELKIGGSQIPFDIPENWVWCRLGEIGESTIGIIFKPSQVGKIGIPVLRANNVQNGKIDYADLISVNTEVREKQIANIGDILLCVRSGSNNLIGKAAMIEKEGMSFGAFMSLYRSEFNSYILKFMHSDIFKKQINDKKSTGINQLTQGTLNNIMIPLPPLSEQKRIVAEIEKQLAKTKQLKEHIIANQQATEQLLKALLHQAFEVN